MRAGSGVGRGWAWGPGALGAAQAGSERVGRGQAAARARAPSLARLAAEFMAAPLSSPQCTAVGVGTAEPGPSAARGAPPLAAVSPSPPFSPEQTGPPRTLPACVRGAPGSRPRAAPAPGRGRAREDQTRRPRSARGASSGLAGGAGRGAGLRNRPACPLPCSPRRRRGCCCGQGRTSLPRCHLEKWRIVEGKVACRRRAPRRGAFVWERMLQGSLRSAAPGLRNASVGSHARAAPRASRQAQSFPLPSCAVSTGKWCGRHCRSCSGIRRRLRLLM